MLESLKKPNRLVVAFSKRIFQASIPVSITLIYNAKKKEEEILIADNEYKLRIYDKNTFEILHSFLGPLYDDVIRHFVSVLLDFRMDNWVKIGVFGVLNHFSVKFYIRNS